MLGSFSGPLSTPYGVNRLKELYLNIKTVIRNLALSFVSGCITKFNLSIHKETSQNHSTGFPLTDKSFKANSIFLQYRNIFGDFLKLMAT